MKALPTWKTNGKTGLLHTRVFDVQQKDCENTAGIQGQYFVMDAPDWVMVLPLQNGAFTLVRQWRHGAERHTLEFPGGVVDEGETPAEAALREVCEEIAMKPKKLIPLGSVNPNPALFTNRVHFFLATDLTPLPAQNLDNDEFVEILSMPEAEVIASYGTGDFQHALTGTALALLQAYKNK